MGYFSMKLYHVRAFRFRVLSEYNFVRVLYRLYPSSVPCLRLVDLYYTCARGSKQADAILSTQLFECISSCLELNLSSPFSLVIDYLLIMTLHILYFIWLFEHLVVFLRQNSESESSHYFIFQQSVLLFIKRLISHL